ncbi:hypothetical protein TNIN_325771 [Trichonephila inaurata madagascariensis]|uniref:Uncharacterized protein n=1 Tax=Trichonephila inaurata madagascariensis TaxID=2747483 RepID=A0A8X6YHC7_9ARAC|nr:hypothetical protein TNIN_325771 [Trichonephila inaurata madagascariensis]
MLRGFVIAQNQQCEYFPDIAFRQDGGRGTSPHIDRRVKHLLKQHFTNVSSTVIFQHHDLLFYRVSLPVTLFDVWFPKGRYLPL